MFRKILIANDGSEGAKKALLAAIDLAKRYGADLHEISIEQRLPYHVATTGEVTEAKQDVLEYFLRMTQEAEQTAQSHGVRLTSHVQEGHEVETIVTFAKNNGFDLLVMGFMGHSKIFGRIWGSTSQNLTKLSPCSVLVIK